MWLLFEFYLSTDIDNISKYYIEQPYQGIYKIDSQLFERLQETD